MKKILHILFFCLCGLLLQGAVRIETQLSSNSGLIGEPLQLQISIISDKDKTPAIIPAPFPSGLPLRAQRSGPYTQKSTNISYVNGKRNFTSNTTYGYVYTLYPTQEGKFTIPSMEFKVDGRPLRSTPVTLTILRDQNSAASKLREAIKFSQAFDVSSTVPGKAVRIHWKIGIPLNSALNVDSVNLPSEEIERQFILRDPRPVETEPKQQTINGIPYRLYDITQTLLPRQEGTIRLPAACLQARIRLQNNRRQRSRGFSPFDDDDFFAFPFGSSGNYQPLSILSNEATLQVAPLPTEGRPANFSGLMGPMTATASVAPDSVAVGDPMTLTITLRGPSILNDSKLPDLRLQKALTDLFRISGDDPGVPGPDGSISFQRTLRATTDKVTAIPSIELPYYDASANRYEIAKTPPVGVQVEPAKFITISDASKESPMAIQPSVTPEARTDIHAITRDIAPNYPAELIRRPGLSPRQNPLTAQGFSWQVILPAVILLIALAIKVLLRLLAQSPRHRATRHARSALLQGLKHATDAAQCYDAFQNYLTVRFHLPPGTITLPELRQAMDRADLPEAAKKKMTEALSQTETARYAGQNTPLDTLKELIADAIR